jgi:hypothetical protein
MAKGGAKAEGHAPTPKGLFVWMARHPTLILSLGSVGALLFLAVSYFTKDWTWFPRGGALMALAGFIVSVQELLKFRPFRPAVIKRPSAAGFEGLFRVGPRGVPVFNPQIIELQRDPEATEEELRKQREEFEEAWVAAEPLIESEETVEGEDPGYQMRELNAMSSQELSRFRTAAIFGVIGTFIWAFGDLPRYFFHHAA